MQSSYNKVVKCSKCGAQESIRIAEEEIPELLCWNCPAEKGSMHKVIPA